jgi:hypothetical protein
MIAGSSKQAAPASEPNPKPKVPSPFRGLADVLRNNGAMTKSALGSALLKSNPKAYSGYKNLKTLLSAAAQEGIVGLRLNKHREEVWSLEERYA